MKSLISKMATSLLAPVILSASCLSCLIQVTPVYAAAPTAAEIRMDGQGQNCENYKKPTEESVTNISTSQPVISMTNGFHVTDRNVHVNHGADCGHAYSQANFEVKSFHITNFHPLALGFFNNEKSRFDYSYRPYFDPLDVLIKNKNLLTGTTIKKE